MEVRDTDNWISVTLQILSSYLSLLTPLRKRCTPVSIPIASSLMSSTPDHVMKPRKTSFSNLNVSITAISFLRICSALNFHNTNLCLAPVESSMVEFWLSWASDADCEALLLNHHSEKREGERVARAQQLNKRMSVEKMRLKPWRWWCWWCCEAVNEVKTVCRVKIASTDTDCCVYV